MTVLLTLLSLLLLAHWHCARLARHSQHQLMRPADELEADDVDLWLDLIEPFPLDHPTRERP